MAALTPGTVCASAWQSSWVSIPFQSCHLCGSSGLFYSLSHQAHEREAAAGTGCIHLCLLPSTGCCHLCLHPAVFGTAPVAGQAAGIASSLLQSRFPLQSVTPQKEGFFPGKRPSRPAVSISGLYGKMSLTASLVPQGGASHQLFVLCLNSSEVLLSGGLPGAVVSVLPLPVVTQSALPALH